MFRLLRRRETGLSAGVDWRTVHLRFPKAKRITGIPTDCDMREAYPQAYRRFGTRYLRHMGPVGNPGTGYLRAFARRLERICAVVDGSAETHPWGHRRQ